MDVTVRTPDGDDDYENVADVKFGDGDRPQAMILTAGSDSPVAIYAHGGWSAIFFGVEYP